MKRGTIAMAIMLGCGIGSVPAPSQPSVLAQAMPIDINTASAEQLSTLPGVSGAQALAIVRGRPYANKAQLVTKGVLPYAVYDRIADRIIATPR